MRLQRILPFFFLLLVVNGFGQGLYQPNKYYVQFTDKNNSPYSLDHPEAFLSQRAIDRRANQNIEYDMRDLPVNPQYLQGVADVGAQILNPTKWLNGVTVKITDPAVVSAVEALPYVSSVTLVTYLEGRERPKNNKTFFEHESVVEAGISGLLPAGRGTGSYDYGAAYNQINLINGIPLHEMGYRGQGMVIAVLDAGFDDVQTHPVFDSLWANNQILGTKDFIVPGGDVFVGHSHGRMVLSTMGANKPGLMIGTAPKASYWLLRPENPVQEYIAEEYNWVSAAEFADSVGADVINSSLGYIDFEDPSQDHTYSELDGNTAVVTIGADIAASKGILVVNSAGNEGNSWWNHLGFPADGDSVFSIGAVDTNGVYASFSSPGPTYDQRTKPNVVAVGLNATIASSSSITYGSGTSFSSPITAGMVACLWQAMPEKNNMDIQEAVMQSASQHNNPDNYMGWGIPNYEHALWILTSIDSNEGTSKGNIGIVYPIPFSNRVTFKFNRFETQSVEVSLVDLVGKELYHQTYNNPGISVTISGLSEIPDGIYFLKVVKGEKVQVEKIVKR